MAVLNNKRIAKVVKALRAYGPEKIYLFGSWARGEGDSLSDIDLVVIKKTDASFFQRMNEIVQYLPERSGRLDVLVYTPSEFTDMQKKGNAFAEMIIEEGQLLYER